MSTRPGELEGAFERREGLPEIARRREVDHREPP